MLIYNTRPQLAGVILPRFWPVSPLFHRLNGLTSGDEAEPNPSNRAYKTQPRRIIGEFMYSL